MLFTLFLTFLRIGLFTIGGGYAMIPLIEREVVERKGWVTNQEFLDLMAIAQSAPGVFAVNISIFIGYRVAHIRGGIVSALGTATPSVVIILLIALFFQRFKEYPVVEHIFMGIRPAVVALILVPTLKLGKSAQLNRYTLWVPVVTALLIWLLGICPIYILLTAMVGAVVYHRLTLKRKP